MKILGISSGSDECRPPMPIEIRECTHTRTRVATEFNQQRAAPHQILVHQRIWGNNKQREN